MHFKSGRHRFVVTCEHTQGSLLCERLALSDSLTNPPPCAVCHTSQYRTYKIIYRRYAGLFFSMCIDVSDNELALIEAIHLFVEILDHYFENVCELDLVFNFHKVR